MTDPKDEPDPTPAQCSDSSNHLRKNLWTACKGISEKLKEQNQRIQDLHQQTQDCEKETRDLLNEATRVGHEIDQLLLKWEFTVENPANHLKTRQIQPIPPQGTPLGILQPTPSIHPKLS